MTLTLVPVHLDAVVGREQAVPVLLEGPARELVVGHGAARALLHAGVEHVLAVGVGPVERAAHEAADAGPHFCRGTGQGEGERGEIERFVRGSDKFYKADIVYMLQKFYKANLWCEKVTSDVSNSFVTFGTSAC